MSDDFVYELAVNIPEQPLGEQIQIAGLGLFENGSVYKITSAEAESFRDYNSKTVIKFDKRGMQKTSTTRGGTLLAVSKNMYGVSVKALKPGIEEVAETQNEQEEDVIVDIDSDTDGGNQ